MYLRLFLHRLRRDASCPCGTGTNDSRQGMPITSPRNAAITLPNRIFHSSGRLMMRTISQMNVAPQATATTAKRISIPELYAAGGGAGNKSSPRRWGGLRIDVVMGRREAEPRAQCVPGQSPGT